MSQSNILEPARETPVIHRTDVLVVGSGPGGLAAALAAARCGVEVTLLERFGCFGGNITVVGVEGFAWYRHEETVEAGGIGREFEERAKAMDAATPESQSLSYELDSEGFKLVADRLVEEAGIREYEGTRGNFGGRVRITTHNISGVRQNMPIPRMGV